MPRRTKEALNVMLNVHWSLHRELPEFEVYLCKGSIDKSFHSLFCCSDVTRNVINITRFMAFQASMLLAAGATTNRTT